MPTYVSSSHLQHMPASGLQERASHAAVENTHKQRLRALSLQIIIQHTHAPVHKQSHRATVTMYTSNIRTAMLCDVSCCPCRKAKAIELMAVDALLEADSALHFSDGMHDPAAFIELDDSLLRRVCASGRREREGGVKGGRSGGREGVYCMCFNSHCAVAPSMACSTDYTCVCRKCDCSWWLVHIPAHHP